MSTNSKKVLYLITKSNYGGAQKYVLDLATSAKEEGYDVAVACGGTGEASASTGRLVDKLKQNELKTIKVTNFLRNMSFVNDVLAFFEVWKIIIKIKPDVLHVTSSKAGGIGALAGRLAGTPTIIFTSHGLTMDEVWRPRWQRILIYIGTWLTIALSHKSIMISTETYERAVKMPRLSSKIALIKNGVTSVELVDKTAARKKLAPTVSNKLFWVGGMGELHPNKNWSSVIEAVSNLPDKINLLIIGEGEERKKLEKIIRNKNLQERVHLLGFVEGAPLLKAFDVFVLPSKKEGLPYVLLEAGLAELPVIASDLPGNRDIIETGKNGLLIEPSPILLSTTIEMLYRDEGMRRNLGENLKNSVQTDFSINKMSSETFSLYESNTSEV